MPDFSSDAILLRKIEYGDYDYIITFLSETSGKISVIAKNAKKSIRRFQGSLDLFSVLNIQVAFPKKKKDAIPVLVNVDLVNPFEKIRTDVEKVGANKFLAKFDPDSLVKTIQDHLKVRRQEGLY